MMFCALLITVSGNFDGRAGKGSGNGIHIHDTSTAETVKSNITENSIALKHEMY